MVFDFGKTTNSNNSNSNILRIKTPSKSSLSLLSNTIK